MNGPWYEKRPDQVQQIRADLRSHYPTLHLFINPQHGAEVRGTFAVRSPHGDVLDRYQIAIRLLPDYPDSLPEVRELAGRIPWQRDYHMEADGKACVLLPDDRGRCFPEGAPFRQFLDGPLHDFLLGQSLVALGGPWPFGEWAHGKDGIYQFYQDLLKTGNPQKIAAFLDVLSRLHLKPHWPCPCGSGRKIRKCCQSRIAELRRKIPPAVARKAAERLGFMSGRGRGARL